MSQDMERLSGGHMTLVLELNRLAHQMRSAQVGYVPSWILACESASATITALDAEVQASRKLVADLRGAHAEGHEHPYHESRFCMDCGHECPCPTVRAIDGAGL